MSMYAEESKSEIHTLGLIFGVGGCARRKAITGNDFTLDVGPVGNQFNRFLSHFETRSIECNELASSDYQCRSGSGSKASPNLEYKSRELCRTN